MASQKERLQYYSEYDYPKDSYVFYHNKKVRVYLNNGSTLTGYIIKTYKYEIILIKSDGIKNKKDEPMERRTLIPKHSIYYIEDYIKV